MKMINDLNISEISHIGLDYEQNLLNFIENLVQTHQSCEQNLVFGKMIILSAIRSQY